VVLVFFLWSQIHIFFHSLMSFYFITLGIDLEVNQIFKLENIIKNLCLICLCIMLKKSFILHQYTDHKLSNITLLGPSWSWWYSSWIYNYIFNQCISPLTLWVWILLMVRCTRYNIMWYHLSVTCNRSWFYLVAFSRYSGFLHQ
jgi:hypothetical protein